MLSSLGLRLKKGLGIVTLTAVLFVTGSAALWAKAVPSPQPMNEPAKLVATETKAGHAIAQDAQQENLSYMQGTAIKTGRFEKYKWWVALALIVMLVSPALRVLYKRNKKKARLHEVMMFLGWIP